MAFCGPGRRIIAIGNVKSPTTCGMGRIGRRACSNRLIRLIEGKSNTEMARIITDFNMGLQKNFLGYVEGLEEK